MSRSLVAAIVETAPAAAEYVRLRAAFVIGGWTAQ